MSKGNRYDPLVSVVMPAYNSAAFIRDSILSVINQTYCNWELIVVDDCSSDDTCAIVRCFAEEDSRIRLIKNASNMGPAKSRNAGFALSKGDYIALLDSDDLWHPEKLERQISLAKDTDADIFYCSYHIIDENGNPKCNDFIVPEHTNFSKMLISSVISCSTAMFRRKIIDRHQFVKQYYHEDYVFWLQLLQAGFCAVGSSEVLASYRVSATSRAGNKLSSAKHRWQIYRSYLGFSFPTSAWYFIHYALAGFKKYKNVS